ncbi:MAG: PTS sugar transporter subunit IIA [Hyphomicrobiales bacterium]
MPSASTAALEPTSVLATHLKPSLYIPELRSKKKPSVLEEMVETLVEAGVTRAPEAVLEVLRRREALGTTALGKGVAVPHARATLVSGRALVVARSKNGVDFEAEDGEAVQLLFLIVAPPLERDPIYLKLLAEIVRVVRLARTRRKLLDAPDFESVRGILVRAS